MTVNLTIANIDFRDNSISADSLLNLGALKSDGDVSNEKFFFWVNVPFPAIWVVTVSPIGVVDSMGGIAPMVVVPLLVAVVSVRLAVVLPPVVAPAVFPLVVSSSSAVAVVSIVVSVPIVALIRSSSPFRFHRVIENAVLRRVYGP